MLFKLITDSEVCAMQESISVQQKRAFSNKKKKDIRKKIRLNWDIYVLALPGLALSELKHGIKT